VLGWDADRQQRVFDLFLARAEGLQRAEKMPDDESALAVSATVLDG
jgi:hypothetical protein